MTRVLVIYATTHGHTGVIAEAMADRLRNGSLAVDVVACGEMYPSVFDYAGIIVAASVHAGRYQKSVVKWVREHAHEFGSRPTAFVSVSLGVLQKDPVVIADLTRIVERFCAVTSWRPTLIKHVPGALLYTQYNFIQRWLMRRIVAKAGGDTDTSKDYDYTNYDEVRSFADEFRNRLAAAA